MAPTRSIGTWIRRERERKRWSQRQLAIIISVDRKTIDNWENGRNEPRSSMGALEAAFGTRYDELAEPQLPPDVEKELEATLTRLGYDEDTKRKVRERMLQAVRRPGEENGDGPAQAAQ